MLPKKVLFLKYTLRREIVEKIYFPILLQTFYQFMRVVKKLILSRNDKTFRVAIMIVFTFKRIVLRITWAFIWI